MSAANLTSIRECHTSCIEPNAPLLNLSYDKMGGHKPHLRRLPLLPSHSLHHPPSVSISDTALLVLGIDDWLHGADGPLMRIGPMC